MAILSVCVALVAPGLNPERFTNGMKTGIRRFTSALAQARNQAMISGERQTILVDYSGRGLSNRVCFRLEEKESSKSRERSGWISERDRKGRCFPSDVSIVRVATHHEADNDKEGQARLAVLPSGLVQPGLIYLQEGERKRTLRIWPFRAYPEILNGHPRPGSENTGGFGPAEASVGDGVLRP